MEYEFAILKDTLNNGKVILTPAIREKAKKWLIFKLWENKWERIVCTYGQYEKRDLDWNPELTFEECQIHIEGYKNKLKAAVAEKVKDTDFELLEPIIV